MLGIYRFTLPEAQAHYEALCGKLTRLNTQLDAHSIAYATLRRLALEKGTQAEQVDELAKAEVHSSAHISTFEQIKETTSEADQAARYLAYLRSGGDVDNPFWEE